MLSEADGPVAPQPKERRCEIIFEGIQFSVHVRAPRKDGGHRKYILKGISGTCVPGRLLAIMGSSGAGKTTLLDILACNVVSGGKVEGKILVNGSIRNPSEFKKRSCYVLQSDVLLSSATVKEAVTTSALLKLPMSMTKKEKIAQVQKVLKELDLVSCQDTLIGDELLKIKGISGGQKRRVSIGIELVKDPVAIFLDEPSSGLDSEMAVSLIENLSQLCQKGRTVTLTIHQPNSLITSKFVDFMLLAEGKLVYGGPWSESVEFFKEVGLNCPQFTNPTDFFIHALQDEENIEKLAAHQSMKEGSTQKLKDVELGAVSDAMTTKQKLSEKLDDGEIIHPEAPLWYQGSILATRNWLMYLRNPAMLVSETTQYLFMGIFVGLMYLQLNNGVSTGVQDRIGSIWFGMAVLSFTPSFTAVTAWDRERILLSRECGQGLYSIASWYFAKTIIMIPLQTVQTLLYGLVAYFMVGYTITFSNVLIYLAAYAMFQITSETIGVLCAAATTTSTYAVLALSFVLLVLLSFSGFVVSDVPVYFRWVTKISYLTYALAAITISQFDSTTFTCDDPEGCTGGYSEGDDIPGNELLPSSIDNGLSPGVNLIILLCIAIGTRILGYIFILGARRFNFL